MMLFVCGYFRFDTEEVEELCWQVFSSTRKLQFLILLPGHIVRNVVHDYLIVCNISHSAQPVPSHPEQSYNIFLGLSQSQAKY